MIREHLTDNNASSGPFFQTKETSLADGALGQKAKMLEYQFGIGTVSLWV